MVNVVKTRKGQQVQIPSIINALFNHPLAGLIWLPVRIWLGYQWISAALGKFKSPAWMQTGTALKGFWTNAIAIPATGTATDPLRLVSQFPAIHDELAGIYLVRQVDTCR